MHANVRIKWFVLQIKSIEGLLKEGCCTKYTRSVQRSSNSMRREFDIEVGLLGICNKEQLVETSKY